MFHGGSLHDFGINIATSLCRDIALMRIWVDWREVVSMLSRVR